MAPHIIWPMRFVLPLRQGPAPGLAAPARPVPLRPYRRPQAAAGDQDARHAQRPGRQAAEAALHARPSNIPTAGSTMPASSCSTPATPPTAARRSAPAPRCVSARREGGVWTIDARGPARPASTREVRARLLVNAAGPWVDQVLSGALGQNDVHNVRLVQGSHIVVRKKFDDPRAYFFQNDDGRIIFAIPYEDDFTLIGTTDRDYRRRSARRDDHRRARSTISARRRANISPSRSAATTSSGPIPACGRSTTTARRRRRRRRATMC